MKKSIIALCMALLMQTTSFARDIHDWSLAEYASASGAGLITTNVVKNNLSGNITRGEFCDLLVNLYNSVSGSFKLSIPKKTPFSDCDIASVTECYSLGIVSGTGDGKFNPDGMITREQMAKLIVNTLNAAGRNAYVSENDANRLLAGYADSAEVSQWARNDMAAAIKHSIMSGTTNNKLSPKQGATREQTIAVVNRVYTNYSVVKDTYAVPELTSLANTAKSAGYVNFTMTSAKDALKYILIIKDANFNTIYAEESFSTSFDIKADGFVSGGNYTAIAGAKYLMGAETFSLPIDFVYKQKSQSIVPTTNQNNLLYIPGLDIPIELDLPGITNSNTNNNTNNNTNKNYNTNTSSGTVSNTSASAKEMRVFPNGIPFQSQEEAEANMTTVTVDVWTVSGNGQKVAAKKSIKVNKNLAEDVQNIFAEIFNDPSQFPIKSVGGFSWRTTAFGSVSQHSYGTCIDINPTENYYCYADGTAITGTHWSPYEDIYSITPDGIVVSAFAKYGWTWGGSWTGNLRDYMHFTYLGK